MDIQTFTIIGIALFLCAVVVGFRIYWTKKWKEEPRETRSCVLCNQTGTTWSKQEPWECCSRIAVVCSICEREAGDGLRTRLETWHEDLFCPEHIARTPIFGSMDAMEKRSGEEMLKGTDAIHQANLNAAALHRIEKEVGAEMNEKIDWANKMIENIATEDERKALWIALGSRYAKVNFTKAVEKVIRGVA